MSWPWVALILGVLGLLVFESVAINVCNTFGNRRPK
jgi:hypothetical protein